MNGILDHPAAAEFSAEVDRIREIGELRALLEGLIRDVPRFSRVRADSPTPALRLLAYDGLITDAAFRVAAGLKNGSYDLLKMCNLIDVKQEDSADKQGEGR